MHRLPHTISTSKSQEMLPDYKNWWRKKNQSYTRLAYYSDRLTIQLRSAAMYLLSKFSKTIKTYAGIVDLTAKIYLDIDFTYKKRAHVKRLNISHSIILIDFIRTRKDLLSSIESTNFLDLTQDTTKSLRPDNSNQATIITKKDKKSYPNLWA